MLNTDIKKAIDLIRDRRERYLEAASYYDGTQSEVFPSKRWYRLLTSINTDYRFNSGNWRHAAMEEVQHTFTTKCLSSRVEPE